MTITSGVQLGTVTEDAPTTANPTDALVATGTVTFIDVDLSDTHTAAFVAAASNTTALGIFALDGVIDDATAAGSVGWTYTLNNAAAQFLSADETRTEVFTVTVTDETGASSAQAVTITIQGTNDGVTITSGVQSGTVTEDAPTTANPTDALVATGTVTFIDVDLSDTHTAAFVAAASNTTALGIFALDGVIDDATAAGSVGWTYTLNNAAAQFLSADETRTEVFTVTVTDETGASSAQAVTITIQGTNDGVTITSGVQSGTVTEDAPTTANPTDALVATGAVTFSDVDLSDTHTAAFVAAASNTTALGIFALDGVIDDATAAGSVGWTYTLNNAAAQFLSADETRTEVFTVTVTDETGASNTQAVTITIQGTNEGVTITSGVQSGTVTEDAPTTANPTDGLVATGTVTFIDVDLSDTHTAAFVAAASNTTALGIFALDGVIDDATAAGSVGWTYTLNNAAAQFLSADETRTEVFTVTVTDETGASSAQAVTITIQGTNDGVTITSGVQSGTVTEDAPTTANPTDALVATGAVTFSDVDLSDTHTAAFVAAASNTTALGIFALDGVIDDATAAGSVGWTYTLNNAAAQFLSADETRTEVFTVTVTDETGASSAQAVTITIQGTNEGVTITSGVQSGTVTEDAPTTANPTDALVATGTVTFIDVDLSDTHTAAFVAAASNTTALGIFALDGVIDDATAAGSVGWTYTLNNAAAQFLSADETRTEVFTVTVTDETGASNAQAVTITIQGTNEGVTITSGVQSGTVTEDAPTTANPTDGLVATGTVTFIDVDLSDTHTAAFVAAASNTTALGIFALDGVIDDATAAGSVGWTYTLNNAAAQFLSADETRTEVFTVTVTDKAGASNTQAVTITIQSPPKADDHRRRHNWAR